MIALMSLIRLCYFVAVHLAGGITCGDSVHTPMVTRGVHIITICDYARAHFDHHT